MTEIPVHKKSGGVPWWVWALLALLLIALLFWFLNRDDDPEVATDPVAPAVATATPVAEGPITDLNTILATEDLATLSGREVQLSGVTVQRVVGDRTFIVGPSVERSLFVVLNQVPTPGTPTEGRVDVTAGQTLSLGGTMRRVQDGAVDGAQIEDLPAGTDAYLWAQTINVMSR